MSEPILKFICSLCGPSDNPCSHHLEKEILRNQRRLDEKLEHVYKWLRGGICDIIHILNRPQSATLTLKLPAPYLVGEKPMPATILVGGTANSQFQEWTGPAGTGTVVPNAGAPAFASDNPAVATVDPVSGVATGVAPGVANISGTDPVNSLTGSDVLTVTAPPPPPAVSATLTLTAV